MTADAAFDDADLNSLVDGRLEAGRAAALNASLSSDTEGRARLEAWKRQNESLRTMFSAVLAEPIPVRLLPATALHGREEPRDGVARPDRRVAGAVASVAVGATLVGFSLGVLAGLVTDGFGLLPSPAPRPADMFEGRDLAARAAEAHRTFLTDPARPVEIGTGDGVRLARWLRRQPGAGPRIPDLAAQGWSFLGGRVVPGRSGPAAFLVYGSGADRLGLLVSAGEPADGRVTATTDPLSPIAVATFGDGGFGYALTADRGRDWLGRNVGPLRASIEGQLRAGDAAP